MHRKPSYWVYKAVCALVRVFYRRPSVEGLERLPDAPCIIVANHAQMNAPIIADLFLPFPRAIWCAGEMMHLKEVPAYAFRDFWSQKPASVRWFYRILSYLIAPLSVCLFNNAHCIGVYRDTRIMTTMRETIAHMKRGERIVIFPEHDVPHNRIICDFQDRFIDVARMYYRQTGVTPVFAPMYVAPRLRRTVIGDPVAYDPQAPLAEERRRVCDALMDAITDIACGLPRHTVVPYPNIPKRLYPQNLPDEEM